MAKRKSFSINSSLTEALTDTVSAAINYSGELHIEAIPLRKIELDPNNPRELILSFEDVHNGVSIEDAGYEKKTNELESLKSLAKSIEEQGVINPVVVYKFEDKYRLVAGERRTLASIMTKKLDVPARILPAKPTPLKLSLLQWVENIEREDLSTWEKLKNLEKVFDAYAHEKNKTSRDITATEISQILGCTLQHGVNYRNALNSSNTLRLLIQSNQIKNIEKIAFIAKAPNNMESKLIEICLNGASLKEMKKSISNYQTKEDVPVKKIEQGRQNVRVNFGTTTNMQVAKTLLESVLLNKDLHDLVTTNHINKVDWNSYRSVTNAFKQLIRVLEKASK